MSDVGLCMIVKDESHVIARCLESVRPWISYWTIVDTGSTDGTQELVRSLLDGIPGQLLEEPWVDFGHNRSTALAAARPHTAYTLMIDADETFAAPTGWTWPALTTDSVQLRHRTGSTVYWRKTVFANRLQWGYVGVLHEYPEAPGEDSSTKLVEPEVDGFYDGGRSVGLSTVQKYARDARVLAEAVEKEPDNHRYQYYLARSYRDSDQPELAEAAYRRRAEMDGGFAEEIADSLLEAARYVQKREAPFDEVVTAYLTAWESRPSRAEPLAGLARFCREQQRWALGRMFAAHAISIPRPDDLLWIDEEVYDWRRLDEFAVCSSWTGHWEESAAACRMLLDGGLLPESDTDRVRANLDLAEQHSRPAAQASGASAAPARRPPAKRRKKR